MTFAFESHAWRGKLTALCLLGLVAQGCAGAEDPVAGEPEALRSGNATQNGIGFHMIDFVGWNNRDWDVMRHYHSQDVLAVMAGQQTEGIDAHISALQGFIAANPDSHIVQHSPIVLQGDWSCMVGVLEGGVKMATVAKWRDGALTEEYVLIGELKGGAPAFAGKPRVRIENKDPAQKSLTGAEPGWSCTFGETEEGSNLAILSKHGEPAASLAFTDLPPQ